MGVEFKCGTSFSRFKICNDEGSCPCTSRLWSAFCGWMWCKWDWLGHYLNAKGTVHCLPKSCASQSQSHTLYLWERALSYHCCRPQMATISPWPEVCHTDWSIEPQVSVGTENSHSHSPIQQDWLSKLLGYDYSIEYKKGKDNSPIDALSRVHETTLTAISQPIPTWPHE